MKRNNAIFPQIVLPTMLIACFGLFMTVVVHRITEDQRRKTVDAVTREAGGRLEASISNAGRTLTGMRAFWLSSNEVTPEEFQSYGAQVFGSRPELVALEWVDKESVVRYVYPLEGANLTAVGLDMSKYPNRFAPLQRAKEIRSAVMTQPLMLTQGFPGAVLIDPIYRGDEYLGSAIGILRFSTLLADFEKTLPFKDYAIVFSAGDRLLRPDGLEIYTADGRRITTPAGDSVADASAPRISATPGLQGNSLMFADLPWRISMTPRDRSIPPITALSALTSFAVVILAVLFLFELYRTREALERTLARERDFASLVSHQLRAPLTELNWMTDVVADDGTTAEERASTIADMRNIVRQSVRTINELLSISRIERGVMEIKTEDASIATVVDEALMPLRDAAKARGVSFRIDVPPSLTAHVDAPKLVEALRNIVDNAIKYGPAGGTVAVAARTTDGTVDLSVADRGKGIPKDVREKIFDKASAFSKKGTTEGAGLGLYLAKTVVELMGGTVRFETSSAGTTFTIAVPAQRPEKKRA